MLTRLVMGFELDFMPLLFIAFSLVLGFHLFAFLGASGYVCTLGMYVWYIESVMGESS